MLNFFKRNFPRIIITQSQRLRAATKYFEAENVYRFAQRGSELEQKAFEKMVELAKSYNQWKMIHGYAGYADKDPELKARALLTMSNYAGCFFEWTGVYKRSSKGSELKQKALEQMLATADDQDDWFKLLNLVPKGSDAEKKAHEMILSLKETPD